MAGAIDSALPPKIGAFAPGPVFGPENHRFWYHFGGQNGEKAGPGALRKTRRFSAPFFSAKTSAPIVQKRPRRRQGRLTFLEELSTAARAGPQSVAHTGISPGSRQDSVRIPLQFISRHAPRWGTANSNAPRIPPSPIGCLDVWRISV